MQEAPGTGTTGGFTLYSSETIIRSCCKDTSSESQPCPDAPMEDQHLYGRNDHKQQSACRSDGEGQAS